MSYCSQCGRRCNVKLVDNGVLPNIPVWETVSTCCDVTVVDERIDLETETILELCDTLEDVVEHALDKAFEQHRKISKLEKELDFLKKSVVPSWYLGIK